MHAVEPKSDRACLSAWGFYRVGFAVAVRGRVPSGGRFVPHCNRALFSNLPQSADRQSARRDRSLRDRHGGGLLVGLRGLRSGNVPHDLDQLAGIDLVKEAIELDVLRNSRALAKQLDVIVKRLLEIHDGEAI